MDSKQNLQEEMARVAFEICEQWGISGWEIENRLEASEVSRKDYQFGSSQGFGFVQGKEQIKTSRF